MVGEHGGTRKPHLAGIAHLPKAGLSPRATSLGRGQQRVARCRFITLVTGRFRGGKAGPGPGAARVRCAARGRCRPARPPGRGRRPPASAARPGPAAEPSPGRDRPLPAACQPARPGGAPRRSQLGAGSPAPVRGASRRGGDFRGWCGRREAAQAGRDAGMAAMSSLEAVRRKIRSLQEQADAAEERAGRLQREVDQERALREEVGPLARPGPVRFEGRGPVGAGGVAGPVCRSAADPRRSPAARGAAAPLVAASDKMVTCRPRRPPPRVAGGGRRSRRAGPGRR